MPVTTVDNHGAVDLFRVGRQPIFDPRLNAVAYELLYRGGNDNRAVFGDDDNATGQVLLNALMEMGLDRLVGSQLAIVNVSQSFIVNGHSVALPHERIVLEVLESVEPTDSLITALEELRTNGFQLALDDFVYRPGYERLLRLASIVKVDIRNNQKDFREELSRLQRFGVTLLAEKVETPQEFDLCRSLGFELFQGYFFARPRIIGGQRISSDRLLTLRLVAALNDPDLSLKQVESLICRVPPLVQKLLKFINSTHCGMRVEVDSIQRAIAMVGLRKMRTWATLVSLGSMSDVPRELLVLSNVRARMCEILSRIGGANKTDLHFTVGLLSVLDALAGRPMTEILDELPLSNAVKVAILNREGALGATLHLVLEYEAGGTVSPADARLPPVATRQLRQAYIEAVLWADALFSELAACAA